MSNSVRGDPVYTLNRAKHLQEQAAREADRAWDLMLKAEKAPAGRVVFERLAEVAQESSARLYQKARTQMGIEDYRGWLYTNGY